MSTIGNHFSFKNSGMQNGVFRFTSWWLLAFGSMFIAVGGCAVVVTLHNMTGSTPIEVRKFNL